ncbi:hypothetical protein AS156_11220 [Bradyrhizobium macuxiense]|uniref:Uncharacterized protein n=1 Tax=Bradyrhizobium macuxiense TaxID=1755647 RepID=A0A120FLA3_9BRAD|nr:hypothetical protein [Bradyrhizobium macuxiense]KWV51951.1 hypothetical protein AS156_11220 [Bradyrhizobium macuxiense]
MITPKCLLAASIAVGLFAMPAAAHESATAKRYAVMNGKASGSARIPAPHALFPMPYRDGPGGICDHGDNPMIC